MAEASLPALPLATAVEDDNCFCTPLQHLPVAAEDSMEARMLAALTASTQESVASIQASAALDARMTAFNGLEERMQTGVAATVATSEKYARPS